MKWVILGLIVLWIIVMWYIVIHATLKGWGPYVRSKRKKKTRVGARISHKGGSQELNPLNWQMEYVRKVLVFECEDGSDRDYEVHDDLWNWVDVGDDGVLVYQGHLFVDFEANRPRLDPEKVYKQLTRH